MSDTTALWQEVRELRADMDRLQERRKVLDQAADDLISMSDRLAAFSQGLASESKTAEQLSVELANLFSKEVTA